MLGNPLSPLDDDERRWRRTLALLVGVRVAIPLATLAFSGHALPGLPAYRYQPLNGDSFVYYAAAREFIASFLRVSPVLILLSVGIVVAASAIGVRCWRGRPRRPAVAILVPAAAVSLALTLPIHEMRIQGGGTIGWSMLLALPLLPIRAVGLNPSPDVAFAFGLAFSLVAIAVSVVATAYVGLYATGRRSVGLIAAGLLTVWPLVSGQLVGHSAWENGQWNVDVGLHLYTEPLSTALIVLSVAIVLRPATTTAGLAGAGLAAGYATATRLTNGFVGLALALLVAIRRGPREAVPYAIGGLVSAPLVIVFWPKGYIGMFDGKAPPTFHPWSLSYVGDAWGDSLIFTPRLLLILLPLFVAGCVAIRDRWALAVVLAPIVVNAGIYSFYYVTAIHPRFLYVTLPFVFVLEAAGLLSIADAIRRRRHRPREVRVL